MILDYNNLVSALSGTCIMIACFLVMELYWKLSFNIFKLKGLKDPSSWFAHGVCMGFFAVGLNALFWKFTYRIAVMTNKDWLVGKVASYGGYFDLIIFVLTIWAAFCHLFSAYLNLDKDHRRSWTWITIPWYPSPNFFTQFLHRILKRNTENKED